MEDIIIPGWSVYLISAGIGWFVWLSLQVWQNQKDTAVNAANGKFINSELVKINQRVDNRLDKMDSRLDKFEQQFINLLSKLSDKLDSLKSETEYLKAWTRSKG